MPEKVTRNLVGMAIGLPPAEAIKLYESKGFEFTWNWREQLNVNHSTAFTVAKAMKADVLQDIRDALLLSLREGVPFREFQKELIPMLQAKGWWGQKVVEGKMVELGSPRRLRTIYDTNMNSAFNGGRWKRQQDNKENRPFIKYVAVLDQKTRPAHRAWDGVIKPVDDPWWDTRYPPNGWRCRCRTRALSPLQAQRSGGVTPNSKIDKKLKPDEGFENNPGKKQWEPEKKDYDADIWKVTGLGK